jgi:hypothetical protein
MNHLFYTTCLVDVCFILSVTSIGPPKWVLPKLVYFYSCRSQTIHFELCFLDSYVAIDERPWNMALCFDIHFDL